MTTMPVYFMISYYVDWILEHFCTSFSDTATVDEATGTQHVMDETHHGMDEGQQEIQVEQDVQVSEGTSDRASLYCKR